MADVDGDGDLDAFVTNNFPEGNKVWLNDGSAGFSDSGLSLGTDSTHNAVDLADLDGDGDPDAFVGSFGPNRVYLNGGLGLPQATFDVNRETNEKGDEVYYWAAGNDAMLPVMLSRTVTQTVEVHARIEMTVTVVTATLPFDPGEQLQYLHVMNPNPEPNETMTVTLSVTLAEQIPGPGDVTDRLLLVFVDGDQGLKECYLCYVEWLARFLGFNPTFGILHHLALPEQEASPQWDYYTVLFDLHSPELTTIVALHPSTLWSSLVFLGEFAPLAQSLEDGNGGEIVTVESVQALETLLDDLESHASPGLQAAMQREREALDLPSFAGMTVQEAWEEFMVRRDISQLYLSVLLKNGD